MISLMSNLNSAAQNELSARSWRIRNVTVSWGSEVVVHHFFLAGQHSYQTPGRPPQLHPPVIPFPPLAHLCRFLDFFAESCGSLTHRLWPRDPYGTQKSGSGAPICGSELDVSQNHLFREKNKQPKAGISNWPIFPIGCSASRGASFLHTVYTSLHSGTTLLCRSFWDERSRDSPVRSTRSTTRRGKSRLAAMASDTVKGCTFETAPGATQPPGTNGYQCLV